MRILHLYKMAGREVIKWSLDDMGVLTISSSGRMPDFSCGKNPVAPWDNIKDSIVKLVIRNGITEIGIGAFKECRNLKTVIIPHSVHRIHAYAFKNCTSLEVVETDRKVWRYIYDKKQALEEEPLLFGIESFLNCPWAVNKWNNFYIQDNICYVCFSDGEKIEIPEGVNVLKQFSIADISADEIVCPSTLKSVEAFAFSKTVVRKRICFTGNTEFIDKYALADCIFGYLRLPHGYAPADMKKKRTYLDGSEKFLDLWRTSDYAGKYYLGIETIRNSNRFCYLKIMKRKPVFHKDGHITSIWDSDYIDVGISVLRKIQRGSVLICVEYNDEKVKCIKVIAMRHIEEYDGLVVEETMPCVYLMYPLQADEYLTIWRDSYTYFDTTEIRDGFSNHDGTLLTESNSLRICDRNIHEDWFWYAPDRAEREWSRIALDVLKIWFDEHPEMRADTEEENVKKDATRWFVDV